MSKPDHQTSITSAGAEENLIHKTGTRPSPAEPDTDDHRATTIEQEQQGHPDETTTS